MYIFPSTVDENDMAVLFAPRVLFLGGWSYPLYTGMCELQGIKLQITPCVFLSPYYTFRVHEPFMSMSEIQVSPVSHASHL